MHRKPTLIHAEHRNYFATLTLRIDRTLDDFVGHFPQHPIFPGVSQLTLAIDYAREYFDLSGIFAGMDVIKFQHPIFPDAMVELQLEWRPDSEKLYFSFHQRNSDGENITHSSGRIRLKAEQ